MDATTRWETEAIRDASTARRRPPKPSKASTRSEAPRRWVTLREAEADTGIPMNTIRKWARREAIPTYLESDGELALRMVDLNAVRSRAHELGRDLEPEPVSEAPRRIARAGWSAGPPPTVPAPRHEASATQEASATREPPRPPSTESETMIVPVDAWNKMLTQLGNLHEAGQQLAEARERAAKAETEAAFLRERLSELRSDPGLETPRRTDSATPTSAVEQRPSVAPSERDEAGAGDPPTPTAPLWRHFTSGWRGFGRSGKD